MTINDKKIYVLIDWNKKSAKPFTNKLALHTYLKEVLQCIEYTATTLNRKLEGGKLKIKTDSQNLTINQTTPNK